MHEVVLCQNQWHSWWGPTYKGVRKRKSKNLELLMRGFKPVQPGVIHGRNLNQCNLDLL